MWRRRVSLIVVVAGLLGLGRPLPGQEVDCDRFPINVVVHEYPIDAPGHQTQELLLESDDIRMVRAGSTRFYVSIVSQMAPGGSIDAVQGFTLAFNVRGNVTVDASTLEGTSSAFEPDGIARAPNIAYTEVIDPGEIHADGKPQGQGVIVAVVYSFQDPVTMIPTGTANVVAVDVSAPADDDPAGEVVFRDGLQCGTNAENILTVAGQSQRPGPEDDPLACARGASIVAVDEPTFVRADADGNGQIELTDGIFIHGFLFLGRPAELPCADAADVNDSGGLDITDGVLVFLFLFNGGVPPVAPFPRCGLDRDSADALRCERFDRCP